MRGVGVKITIGIIAFTLGIAFAGIWICQRPATITMLSSSGDCVPVYDADLVVKRTAEDVDPKSFAAFREPPLYAMPDCVEEAYSLTWIPSFNPPVLVRVWRSGNKAFMVAKELDQSWPMWGNVKETNARPLTEFEWRDFTELLKRTSYWELPATVDEILPEDGAAWRVDGLRAKQYHWVTRRVPNEHYAEICKHLIRLSGLETAHSLYLPSLP